MAIVAEGRSDGVSIFHDQQHEEAAHAAMTIPAVDELDAATFSPTSTHGNDYRRGLFGLRFDDLSDSVHCSRQLVALTTFSDLVGEARRRCWLMRASAGSARTTDAAPSCGGAGATAYADAVATYLALCRQLSVADRGYVTVRWSDGTTKVSNAATVSRGKLFQ